MASWITSPLRLRRKYVINVVWNGSFRSFTTENDNGYGRGRVDTLSSLDKTRAPGSDGPSNFPTVQGRGRKSRLAEQLGVKLDPLKEEAKLRQYVAEKNIDTDKYEDVEIPKSKQSKIRVVQSSQSQESAPDFQKLEETTEEVLSSEQSEGSLKNVKAEAEIKDTGLTETPIKSPQENDWLLELVPQKKKNAEEDWLDEFTPGAKLKTAFDIASVWQKEDSPAEPSPKTAELPQLDTTSDIEQEIHTPPIHKAYQEEEEVEEKVKEEKVKDDEEDADKIEEVQEVVEEFVLNDTKSANKQVVVQFENETESEAEAEAEAEVRSDDEGGEDPGEDPGEEGPSQPLQQLAPEDFMELEQQDQSKIKDEICSTEKVVESVEKSVFEIFKSKTEPQIDEMSDRAMEGGGLASLLQGLIKEDRRTTDLHASPSGSLMDKLGWGSTEVEEPASKLSATEPMPQRNEEQRFGSPLQSALAERLGWTAVHSTTMTDVEIFDVEYEMEERKEQRQRVHHQRMMDSYGRMKARTPEERRHRAMQSGKAMEMALLGKLDKFDPESYVEPEIIEGPRFSTGRMRSGGFRGRGRGRGRGRSRSMGRNVPNLFRQTPIEMTPKVQAAPHKEDVYYHEDVMSKLGIKFSQHELMNMERQIQSLVSSSFNFNVGLPTPWDKIKSSTSGQYLESHKKTVKQVMKASGFAFSEDSWRQIRSNAVRDFKEYIDSEHSVSKAFGQSLFKNVKDEEASLEHLMKCSVSQSDPLYNHMTTVLPLLFSNPTWVYSKKRNFVELASKFSEQSKNNTERPS